MMESPQSPRAATAQVFFDTLRQIACINGYNGQFLAVNPAFTATLGWTADDLHGVAYYDLVSVSERRSLIKLGALIVRHAGGDPRTYRRAFRHKDGSYRVIEWSAWADAKASLVCAVGRVMGVVEPR
jgi:PAS domain S-box-containing protein